MGILSRGLLLPLVVVSEHGGARSDAGMLGNAIYFTDDVRYEACIVLDQVYHAPKQGIRDRWSNERLYMLLSP